MYRGPGKGYTSRGRPLIDYIRYVEDGTDVYLVLKGILVEIRTGCRGPAGTPFRAIFRAFEVLFIFPEKGHRGPAP